MSSSTKRFADIQVLRAIACTMVIAQHLSLAGTLFSRIPGPPTIPFYLGVDLFFVISGYVVTRSLFARDANPIAFLVRRFFRLTPAIVTFIIFSLFVFTCVATLGDHPSAKQLNMTGAGDFLRQSVSILCGVLINFHSEPLYYFGAMWSLSVEYQFYFGYALVVGVFQFFFPQKIKRLVLIVAVFLAVLALCARLNWFPRSFLSYILTWRFDFLLAGVGLALLTARYGAIRLPSRKRNLQLAAFALLSTLVVAALSESPFSAAKPMYEHVLLPYALVAFTALIALATSQPETQSVTDAASDRSRRIKDGLVWLGDRSYAMYLFHFPVMALVWWLIVVKAPWLFHVGPIWYGLVQAVATFALTILLADLTYRFIEVPWNVYGETVSRRLEATSAHESPKTSVG